MQETTEEHAQILHTAQQSKADHSYPLGTSLCHDSDEIGMSTMRIHQ